MSTMPLLHVCDMYIKSWCKLNGYHSYNKWRKSNIWKNIILEFSYIQKQFLSSLRKEDNPKKLKFPRPKDALCYFGWNWPSGSREKEKKCDEFRTSTTPATTTDNRQTSIRKAQLSLWLRWAKNISDERWNFLSKINKLPSQSLSIRHSRTWLQLLKWKLRQV